MQLASTHIKQSAESCFLPVVTDEFNRVDSRGPRGGQDIGSDMRVGDKPEASPQAQRNSGGVITPPQPEHHSSVPHPVRDGSGDDVSYASNSNINFGLSPHDLFNRAHNEGQYHEYEHHDDGNVGRGFRFQLDAQSSCDDTSDYRSINDSASDSRSIDDHG